MMIDSVQKDYLIIDTEVLIFDLDFAESTSDCYFLVFSGSGMIMEFTLKKRIRNIINMVEIMEIFQQTGTSASMGF